MVFLFAAERRDVFQQFQFTREQVDPVGAVGGNGLRIFLVSVHQLIFALETKDKTQIAGSARSKILNKIASADGRQRAELIQNIIAPSGQLTAAAVRKLYKLLIRL